MDLMSGLATFVSVFSKKALPAFRRQQEPNLQETFEEPWVALV